jgi:hypothetical protein
VDATKVELHHLVDGARPAAAAAPPAPPVPRSFDRVSQSVMFDRVVYNFPYAHVTKFSKEFRQANLHLLRSFFARSAVMLAHGGACLPLALALTPSPTFTLF